MKVLEYEDYLKEDLTLSFEEAISLHHEIIEEIDGDEDAKELYDEIIEKAIQYANIRAKWSLMSPKERADIDASRTSTHDSLIIKFNHLARYLKMQGKEARWRDQLGYVEENKRFRKRIGDMGCFLAHIHSLNAR